MIAISDKNYALVFRAMQEKQASSNLRVKVARHAINMKLLEREIATYNLDRLQKAASDGHSKIARMKFAALVLQHQVEKRAFARALLKGLGRGAINMGGKAIGGALGLGAKGVSSVVKKAPLMSTAAAVYGGTQLPSREEVGNTFQKRVVDPVVRSRAGNAVSSGYNAIPARQDVSQFMGEGIGNAMRAGGRIGTQAPGAISNMFGQAANAMPSRHDIGQSLGEGMGNAMRFVGRQFGGSARPSQPQARPNLPAPFADPVSRLPAGVPQNDEPA